MVAVLTESVRPVFGSVSEVHSLRDLLVRPTPIEVEGNLEYVLRLAWANGVADVRWLAAKVGPQRTLRFCARCLVEEGHWHSTWNHDGRRSQSREADQSGAARRIGDLPICLAHQVWLRSHCHACGQALRWPRVRLLRCACGVDLRQAPNQTVGAALRACLDSAEPPATAVLLWLGAWALHGPRGKPLKKASVTGVAEQARLLERGAEIVMGWPQTWLAEMARHRRGSPDAQLQRLSEAWPGLPIQIRRLPDSAWRDRVWSTVDTLVGLSHDSDRPLVGRHPCLSQRPPTQKAIAQALGIGIARLQTTLARTQAGAGIARDLDVPAPRLLERRSASGRVRRVIAPDLMAQVAHDLTAWVSVREAATVIGCGRKRVPALIDAGCLPLHLHGPRGQPRLRRSDVEAVRDRILQRARDASAEFAGEDEPSAPEPAPGGWARLSRVWRLWVPAPASGGFVEAVADGRVRVWAERGATDWRGVRVAVDDVEAWRTQEEARARDTLSLTEAARALGIKDQVAYELANRGWLPTFTLRIGRRAARRVPTRAVGEFAEKYVALSALTTPEGIHSHAALGWAQARGLKVISGPRIDGARQYFVERTGKWPIARAVLASQASSPPATHQPGVVHAKSRQHAHGL